MEKVFIYGAIEDNMLVIGKIIKWMEKESLLGRMEEDMKVNIKMIKKKDMEFLNGLMVKNIEDIGLMENKMEKVNFIIMLLNNGKDA